jgi:D-citramalate synthase
LLEELNVDRIEIASARVAEERISRVKGSLGEHHTNRIEVLTFVDGGLSIEWMKKRG